MSNPMGDVCICASTIHTCSGVWKKYGSGCMRLGQIVSSWVVCRKSEGNRMRQHSYKVRTT